MKNTKSLDITDQVQFLFYDGNTPIGQLQDGREVALTKGQVKTIMARSLLATPVTPPEAHQLHRVKILR